MLLQQPKQTKTLTTHPFVSLPSSANGGILRALACQCGSIGPKQEVKRYLALMGGCCHTVDVVLTPACLNLQE